MLRNRKLLALLATGAGLPVVVTCKPLDAVIELFDDDGVVVLREAPAYYVVDEDCCNGHSIDFNFWHEEDD